MSRDEIIAMGNEAALQNGHTYEPEPGDGTIEFLGSFAALVAAKEREACAQIAQATVCDTHIPTGIRIYGTKAAQAIRARGKP